MSSSTSQRNDNSLGNRLKFDNSDNTPLLNLAALVVAVVVGVVCFNYTFLQGYNNSIQVTNDKRILKLQGCGLPNNDYNNITDEELEDLAEKLINMDTENNATSHIFTDRQRKTWIGAGNDEARFPLFAIFPEAFSKKTIQKLMALQNIYSPENSKREYYTRSEENRIDDFIYTIFNTPIMQAAQEFLESKNISGSGARFRQIWFDFHAKRNDMISSCGFKHVFTGELHNDGDVGGLHNWVYFAEEERHGLLNYMGYMKYVDLKSKGSIIQHTFMWRGQRKPVSSMFIGTSPEFEISIYTVCFLARPCGLCPISLDGRKVNIFTWPSDTDHGRYLATAFPDLSANA